MNNEKKEPEIINIPIDKVKPSNFCQEKDFSEESIRDLVKSIEEHGLLQPILVRRTDDGEFYEIIAGERRLAASKVANKETIQAIVLDIDDYTMAKMFSLSEQ